MENVHSGEKLSKILHRLLCQSISRMKNLLNWCWRPAKTSFLSVSKLIKWMWWVVKYKREKNLNEGGGAKMWCIPEMILRWLWDRKILKDPERLFQVSQRRWRTLKMSLTICACVTFPDALSLSRAVSFKSAVTDVTRRLMSWLAIPSLGVGDNTALLMSPTTHLEPLVPFHFSFLIFWTCACTAVNNYNVELLQLEFMRLSQLAADPISHYLLLFRLNTRCAHAAQLNIIFSTLSSQHYLLNIIISHYLLLFWLNTW